VDVFYIDDMNRVGLMNNIFECKGIKVSGISYYRTDNYSEIGKGPTSEVRDSPSALRAWSSKDDIHASLFRRDIASYATATAEGGIPASWATLSPWLSLFTPGRRRWEYEKEPS